ncbi:MAG: bifunctional hydroxymethylpyrimidine kinase/phosphomethylpyrimidine kinase [Pyrinomonadaceae bacterium]
MNVEKKICLSIAGLDPSGGAGILADIKTFNAFGCFGTAAVSSITFQNTQGVYGAEHQSGEQLKLQVLPILDDFKIDGLKTGMLPTEDTIEAVAEIVEDHELPNFVVDPVVRSTSGFDLIPDKALKILVQRLFPLSKLVTPNLPEAERIAEISISSQEDLIKAGERIRNLGAQNVLIKGGHFESNAKSNDYLFTENGIEEFAGERINTTATHGTGCTLSAAIAANMALELPLSKAILAAKEFVTRAIKNAPNIGKGNSPIDI